MLPQNAFKKSLWLAPGVAGAIVPCVCRALFIVKLHPGDQVQEPEISNFITWRYWRRFELRWVQLPGVPLPWLCKALRGKAARQENRWDHQTNFYHHAEEKATTYLLLQQILTSGRWPPHPMFLFFVGNCIYTYKGLSILFRELKPNLKSDGFVVNFSS